MRRADDRPAGPHGPIWGPRRSGPATAVQGCNFGRLTERRGPQKCSAGAGPPDGRGPGTGRPGFDGRGSAPAGRGPAPDGGV